MTAGPGSARADAAADEMVDGSGRIRTAWRRSFDAIQGLGPLVLNERARLLERAAIEEGAAALLADRDAPSWRCDPIPLMMSAAEFGELARGLAERASLLEHVLADLYGPQTLLREGIVPPSLVYASPDFLRPARGERGRRLLLYAADLVRAPDGSFRVVGDRCARPSGIGRLLENRRLLRRVMPELFRGEVTGLARFFELWRDVLGRRSERAAPGAGVVLLCEGHRDPAWFEQVLLARELGCDLVQGGDLTLRDGALFVKRLRGLAPVATVLARQDPRVIDPLELDWTAGAGIPGLLALQRSGRVAVLNDPGAALVEAPGFAAFLPAIARHLLGRDVLAAPPSVPTLWLGDADARAEMDADPERWTVRSATDPSVPPVRAALLGPRGRTRLLSALREDGERYVATADVLPSAAPSVGPDGLVPRPVSLRIFLLHDGTRWLALPSGFVRVLGPGDDPAGRLPGQGLSKDLFVIPDPDGDDEEGRETGRPVSSEKPPMRVRPEPRRVEGDLPARIAEEFFSLGREMEQLETGARLARALAIRLERYAGRPRELVDLRILAAAMRRTGLLPPDLLVDPAAAGLADALAHLATGASPLAGAVRRTAMRIERLRDRITTDMHGTLNRSLAGVFDGLPEGAASGLDQLGHVTAAILGFTATLAGLVAETMTRGGSRLFLELGLRLERAETVIDELATALGPAAVLPGGDEGRENGPDLDAALDLLLELRDSSITYRSRYPGRVEPGLVLDLLLGDRLNPRGLAFQLAEAAILFRSLGEVSGVGMLDRVEKLRREIDALVSIVLEADDPDREAASLHDAIRAAGTEIVALRRAVGRRYIDLLPAAMRTVGG